MSSDSESPLLWFSQHPVVSTVLWIFRGQLMDAHKPPSNSKLSWSDEHGKQLTQLMDNLAIAAAADGSNAQGQTPSNASTPTQLDTPTPSSNSSGRSILRSHSNLDALRSHSTEEDDEADGRGDDTVSPQWGWYVSITPPHDQYSSVRK